MACSTITIESIYAVRWDNPEPQDLRRIDFAIAELHKKLGKPCIYLAIVPQDAETPSNEMRSAMIAGMTAMLEHCESIHFVIEGSGFKHTVLRSALAGILLVAGRRGRVFVHTTVQDALQAFAAHAKLEPSSILRSLRTQQFVA
jgi:hypothetical protein